VLAGLPSKVLRIFSIWQPRRRAGRRIRFWLIFAAGPPCINDRTYAGAGAPPRGWSSGPQACRAWGFSSGFRPWRRTTVMPSAAAEFLASNPGGSFLKPNMRFGKLSWRALAARLRRSGAGTRSRGEAPDCNYAQRHPSARARGTPPFPRNDSPGWRHLSRAPAYSVEAFRGREALVELTAQKRRKKRKARWGAPRNLGRRRVTNFPAMVWPADCCGLAGPGASGGDTKLGPVVHIGLHQGPSYSELDRV